MKVNNIDYRKIDKINASAIKMFDKSRFDFYKYYVLKTKKTEDYSPFLAMGLLIDFILSDCKGSLDEFDKRFDEKFKLLSVKKGSGQMFLLVDELFKFTLRDMDEEGNITSSFSTRFEEAFDKIQSQDKFKGKKVEWALEQFRNSDEEIYFQECLESIGKYVVDQSMLEKAKSVVEMVIQDENVNWLFNSAQELDNLGKTVIEFEYLGMECKCEIDLFHLDYTNKKAIITEIKTNWDIINFQKVYLKLRYYLSAAFYYKAVEWYLKENNLKDWIVEFQFLSIDTSPNKLKPIIYTLNDNDINKSIQGFSTIYDKYRGLNELMEDIKWSQDNQIWNVDKFIFEKNNKVPLEIVYL